MGLNVDKYATVLYSRWRTPCLKVNIILNGWQIEWTNRYKYLGLTFDRQLSWTYHAVIVQQCIKVLGVHWAAC